MRWVWIVFALVFVSVIGMQESFAEETEFIQSPKHQLESGIAAENVQCRGDLVLVQRTNGNVACVTERTVERTGWEIIETVNVQSIPVITEKTIEIIPKEKTSWISSATDLSYMDLEKIPNPEGYWVPIQNKDAFARALVNATGDKLTNENKFGKADYYTENGKIVISPVYLSNYVISSVYYQMYDSFSLVSESDQLPFINNFMNSMGFKLANEKLSLTEEFLETCDGEYLRYFCTFDDGSTLSRYVTNHDITYKLTAPYSEIKFIFMTKSWVVAGLEGTKIQFNGWTNNPELVQHPLGEKAANNISREFILSTEYFNKLDSDGGTCEAELNESIPIRPEVIAGVPFYVSPMADCTLFLDNTGMQDWPIILIDGWAGEHVFRGYHGGQD